MPGPAAQQSPGAPRKLRKETGDTAAPKSVSSPTPKGSVKPQPQEQEPTTGGAPKLSGVTSEAAKKTKGAAGGTPNKLQKPDTETLPSPSQESAEPQLQKQGIDSGMATGLPGAATGVSGKAKDVAGDTVSAGQDAISNGTGIDLSSLKGLNVGENGQVIGQEGSPIGRVVEGDPEDLAGKAIGDNGEILNDKGELVGRVEALPETAQGAVDQAKNTVTNLADLDGLPVSEGGVIKNAAGVDVGKLVEGDPQDLQGYAPNSSGEILDEDGDLIGRVEIIPQAAEGTAEQAKDSVPQTAKGVVDQAKDSGPQAAKGAADQAKDSVPQAAKGAADQAKSAIVNLADLNGLPVGEGGIIKDKTGREIGKVTEGDPEDLAGFSPNENGEILDEDGDLIGVVEPITAPPDAAQDGLKTVAPDSITEPVANEAAEAQSATQGVKDAAEEKVEEGMESVPDLPPLSTLEGLRCNKLGKIVGPDGKPVGELVEGDAKKITRLGASLDDKGQFWDNRGNVIGKVQTLPVLDEGDEAPFAGLEDLHVVEDGWVEDGRGKRVGKIVEGDPKKVLGRYVDEDGEVTDKYGNVIARAEYYEQPEEPEPETVDLTQLNGLTCTKTGLVIGPEGIPIARVVEGNPKEMAGKQIEDGQIWDGRKPVGRVELIPDNELEKKVEGPFSGLENLVVNKDGFVEDGDGNLVGQVTEGDVKSLRGRAVDEDGDILDKFGSVKGHAEPYEPPEEEKVEQDLSILEGKVVNKSGNVVDAQGNVFGRVTSFDKGLIGRKVDRFGQIWGDAGEVIGSAELIPGAEQQQAEGPFYGFDNAEVGKDGAVTAGDRIIGRLVEGDPKMLRGRKVDEDGHVLDKNGNTIGRAERWEPEEKPRNVNPMVGRKVTRDGEVRDADGNLIGKLTMGDLGSLVGKEIDDNGFVVDNDGNKLGECTLIENLQEEEPAPSEEELQAQKDRELAKKMSGIVGQTLDKVRPMCRQITDVSQPWIPYRERTR